MVESVRRFVCLYILTPLMFDFGRRKVFQNKAGLTVKATNDNKISDPSSGVEQAKARRLARKKQRLEKAATSASAASNSDETTPPPSSSPPAALSSSDASTSQPRAPSSQTTNPLSAKSQESVRNHSTSSSTNAVASSSKIQLSPAEGAVPKPSKKPQDHARLTSPRHRPLDTSNSSHRHRLPKPSSPKRAHRHRDRS